MWSKKIYKTGGAQSIAALTYGTKTFKKVDKIVGPGNIFVASAKKEVLEMLVLIWSLVLPR